MESSLPERWAEMLPELLEDLGRAALKTLVKGIAARQPEVFFGFRPTPEALLSPAILPRLLKAAEQSPESVQKLFSAWRERHKELLEAAAAMPEEEADNLSDLAARFGSRPVRLAMLLEGRKVPAEIETDPRQTLLVESPPPPASSPDAGDLRREREAAKKQAARLKTERRAREQAESEAARAGIRVAELRRLLLTLGEEKDSLQKQAERLQRQIARSQSAQEALQEEIRELQKSYKSLQKSYQDALEERPDAERAMLNALRSLLESGEAGAVAALCRTMKRQNALGESAREYYIAALEALSETGEAVTEQLERAQRALDAGMPSQALRLACEAWDRHPRDTRVERFLDDFFALHREDTAFLHRIEGWLIRWPLSAAARDRVRAIARPPGETRHQGRPFGPERPFLWGRRRYRASALDIIQAIDRNDEALVETVRADLRAKRRESPAWVRSFFQAVGSLDDSCKAVLGAPELSGVVVDGSNVAWHGRRPGDAPDLDHILRVREALRRKGCFPVVVYIDAALVFQSSLPETVRQWVQEEQILMADAGIDADELIVREAARRLCPIVTNDRMREWDPDNRLTKWRFRLYGEDVLIEIPDRPSDSGL